MTSKKASKDYTYYTKGIWIEKKQRAYQAWLSYLLSPSNASDPASLNSKRLFAKVRGCVAKVYHKDTLVQSAMLKVEASIMSGRLKLLTDGGFMVNPRMKKKAMKILLSYDAFWLKLGLETVFRMTLSPKQKGASSLLAPVEEDELQLKTQLTTFVDDHFFSSTDLKKKLKTNVKKRSVIMEELAAVVLKRFLLLVILLDRTLTTADLPDCLPLLFEPSSKIKTSADMIRSFLKGSLFGEGDTVKQLEYMGYTLTYCQGVVNEFDYRVNNLATDFRDGIRSCKLAEVLLNVPVLHRTNFNTGSNAVKVYNVKLGLSIFSGRDKNVALLNNKPIHPQDIVDGLGETTVGYIWNIALFFQIPKLVPVSALVFEILQVKIHARAYMPMAETSRICFPTGYDMRLALLLTWIQTVVGQYGAVVKNFHASFADGSVLCFLICHYLPIYMQPNAVYIAEVDNIKEEISRHSESYSGSDDEEFDSDDEDMDLKQFGVYSGKGWMDKSTFKKHRSGILQNFNAVFSVMRSLGGIPETISALDFEEQGPDETAVILYLSYMCARLLQVSKEERAALTIQRMWKIYKGYADPIELIQMEEIKREKKKKSRERNRSRDSHLTAFEYHRQQYSLSRASSSSGTGTIFSGFDSTYIYLEPKELEAVVKLQAIAKGTLARRQFLKLKKAVAVLEKHNDLIRDRSQYLRDSKAARDAATLIRAHYLRHHHSKSFQNKRTAAVVIQKTWRRYKTQQNYQKLKEAADEIQASIKAMKEKEEAERAEQAATRIQAEWRRFVCRRDFLDKRFAAVAIQTEFRRRMAYQQRKTAIQAAICIQSTYRMHVMKIAFNKIIAAVICLQRWMRMWMNRKKFLEARFAAVQIQAQYRMYVQRKSFQKEKEAAILIQTAYRKYKAESAFNALKKAAIVVQTEWRSFHCRSNFHKTKSAAIVIQTAIRMQQCRTQFVRMKSSAFTIQKFYRIYAQSESVKQMRASVSIQAAWKGFKQRRQFRRLQTAAIKIQRAVRLYQKERWLDDVELRLSAILVDFVSVMERTHEVVKAATILQAYTRGYLVRKHNSLKPAEIKEVAQKKLAVKKIAMGYRGYQLRNKIAKKNAAQKVISRWQSAWKDRWQFLKMRHAARVIQAHWRAYQQRREDAAIVIQRAYRESKTKWDQKRIDAAIVLIQSAWRGRKVRSHASKDVKRAVCRIKSAEKRAQADPTKTLRYKCDQAVQTVKNSDDSINVEQTFTALASLEMGTMYSQRCCMDIVQSDALIPLLRVMAKCNRSPDHQAAFLRGITILKHLCKYKGLTMKVFKATECLDTLCERLTYYRECPMIFTEIIGVFKCLLEVPEHISLFAENETIIRQLNSLWSLLARKVETERKYINKLEADKASDKSARRATEKAFVASHQLVELADVFEAIAVQPIDFTKYAHMLTSSPSDTKSKKKKLKKVKEPTFEDWKQDATQWKPKNTIAKEKLTQLRTNGLSRESSVGPGARNSYVSPHLQKRVRVLSTDMDAEKLERRTNVRLMSDYQKPSRFASVEPTAAAASKKKSITQMSSKLSHTTSLAPVSKVPKVTRKTTK